MKQIEAQTYAPCKDFISATENASNATSLGVGWLASEGSSDEAEKSVAKAIWQESSSPASMHLRVQVL
jgi:hypothetical protein